MPNSTESLHSQLQHSTAVLDEFIRETTILKKESSALIKSVDTISKDFFRQCRRANVTPFLGEPVFMNLRRLKASSQVVHQQASNFKACLEAVVTRSYKPDLQRADKGKPTRVLVDALQEAQTFETHIRLAEELVAIVLTPNEVPFHYHHEESTSLQSAFNKLKEPHFLDPRLSLQNPLFQNLSTATLQAAAVRMRDQIETPSVRQRVGPRGY